MSAPRLTGRPRVEALVACGAHQFQTQGKCTREVGGRESGRGRERERACVPVPLACGGRACTILLQEGGGAQSCSQRRHVNEYGPIAAHTGCTIAGLPRFLTASRRTFARKTHGGRSFPGPSAYCVVHCCLVLQSELGVANFQLPRQLLSVCRLGPETSTNTAHQLQGELAIPVPYLRGTYNEGITYCDPGEDRRNKLTGWVDSDFAADPDTRKSMTGYLFSLNGGAVSWRSSRQGGVTLSSAEAEFVAASQAGQEAVYLRALLRGFNFRQVGATEIWEDNASCIMMSENPANRERTRHVDTRVHYLRELVRDGHVKLLKCAGPQNVADALTKSLPRPALAKHRQYMWGTRIPFSAFYLSLKTGRPPMASYNIITPCGYQVARAA
jgi:hypothetical protein